MLIFLVGMMGAGKSTLGRQLAMRLGYAFIDLDAYIEKREGRTIATLFEQEGQEGFRKKEREALEAVVLEHEQAIVATGGGTPCFFDNMPFISLHGMSIFLDVPVEEIADRLMASNLALRPLLAGKSAAEVKSFIDKTLNVRRQFYEQAQYTLSGKNQTIAALLSLVDL